MSATYESGDDLTCDAITADFRIWQRRRGHRFSLDDLSTAAEAVHAHPHPQRYLDLGCGIGSVLLMVAWRLPQLRVHGVEALEQSLALARRSVSLNGIDERTTFVQGDLRELTAQKIGGPCDLLTGTPPYLPLGSALPSPDPQRAAARLELRGGIEDYLAAAGRLLAPAGRVVICADGRNPERVWRGAEAAALTPLRCLEVFARADASGPLLSVWTLAAAAGPLGRARLFARDASGTRTAAAHQLRTTFGLQPQGMQRQA